MLACICLVGILLTCSTGASPAAAQNYSWQSTFESGESLLESETPESKEKGGFCFKCRPSPQCGSFLITEFGYLKRLARSGYFRPGNDRDFYFLGEVGWMKNIDEKNAIGSTIYFGFDDDGSEFAIKPRYRRWLRPRVNFDISIGPILKTSSAGRHNAPGFIGQAGLGLSDAAMLISQLNIVPYADTFYHYDGGAGRTIDGSSKTETVWYGGLKLTSYPGTAALIAVPLTVVVLMLIALSGSN